MNETNYKLWKQCKFCPNETFSSPFQFGNHLRTYHSKIEGGSHVCSYGPNAMCPLLPYEGVSGRDYETHVAKCHIFPSKTSTANNSTSINSQSIHDKDIINSNVNNKSHYENRSCDFPRPSSSNVSSLNMDHEQICRNDKPNVIDDVNWSIFRSSLDLTSILNDPSKPRSHYDNLFTKDWGINFVDTQFIAPYAISKKPCHLLFDNYISKIHKRNRKFAFKNHHDQASTNNNAQQSPIASFSSYQIVPSLFFDPNFNLDENDTFIKLITLFCSSDSNDPINLECLFADKSMNDIQKSLSEYLDIVEQDLSQQICRRSQDFFQVMSSMDLIMEKLKDSIKQVTCVRDICKRLKENLVEPVQKITQLTDLRCKYRDIYKKINWIATVHQTQPTIQLLLSKSDYAGALDLISTSEEVVAQELNGVVSLRYLRLQLMEIEKVIEQMLNEEFVKYLTAEWNRPLNQDSNDNIQKERLLSIVYGMLKLQNFNFIDTFREEAFTAIKTSVKQTVIETLSFEDNIEVPRIDTSLFEQLKCLCFDKWIACLKILFERLVILLKRVRSVYNVINDGFATMTTNNSNVNSSQPTEMPFTNEVSESKVILQSDYYELSSRLKEILYSICDFAHSRSANIIELRANDGSLDRFDISQFMQLTYLIESFISDCETVCGRKSPNLKLVIQIQSNKFITKFHEERKRKLKQLSDLEQWKSVNNLSQDIQNLCSQLVAVEEYPNLMEIYSNFKNKNSSKFNSNSSQKIMNQNHIVNCNYIALEDEKFVIVNTVINLVYMIMEYCELAQQFSSLSADILLRLIDLLKSFNSRTSQLILGAEALQVAGLKTISARTLIISMRSLIFILKFKQRIRNHFERLLRSKLTMLKHLDELNELFENHYNKIPEKIIGLVKEVVTAHINKWVAKAPIPSQSFQTISQHLSRLHDNIQDILPYQDLLRLFQQIHTIIIQIFREQLNKLNIHNDGGPQHGLVTQELAFYMQNMRNLSIGKDLDLKTNDLWQ